MIKNLVNKIRRFMGNTPSLKDGGLSIPEPISKNFQLRDIVVVDGTPLAQGLNKSKRSRTDIVELMKNSGGRFFTVVFVKADGTERTINGQVKKDNFYDNQGYIIFRESNGNFRKVNPRTIKEISISKQIYKVR